MSGLPEMRRSPYSDGVAVRIGRRWSAPYGYDLSEHRWVSDDVVADWTPITVTETSPVEPSEVTERGAFWWDTNAVTIVLVDLSGRRPLFTIGGAATPQTITQAEALRDALTRAITWAKERA